MYKHLPLSRFLFLLGFCVFSSAIKAAQWLIDPTLQFSSGYNNNITFTTSVDRPSSYTVSFKPNIRFSRGTASSSLNGTLSTDIRRFPEESERNNTTSILSLSGQRSFEHSNIGLSMSHVNDTTLDSELEETGLVFGRTNRISRSFSPNWSWRFNDLTSLNINYSYATNKYDKNGNGYTDSLSQSGQISLSRQINERASITLTASQTLTDNDNDVLSRFTNLQAGFDFNLSETLSTRLFAGARKTTTKFSRVFFLANGVFPFTQEVKFENSGSVFNASLRKIIEKGAHNFSVSRNISNSVSGRLFEVTKAEIDNSHRFSGRLSATFGLKYYQSKSTSDADTISSISQKYYTITPGLNWKLSEFWVLSGHYAFKKQINNFSGKNAIQNLFSINLTYQWPQIAVFR